MDTIAIIGGGPAGLQAAVRLRELGFEATVFEEHEAIGLPENCGGLISRSGVKALGLDLGECLQNEIRGAKIFSPNGTMLKILCPKPVAYVIERKEFDQMLARKAKEKGVKIAPHSRLIDIHGQSLFFKSKERGELKKAEYVIGADGVNSAVRQLMGTSISGQNFIHTAQATCTGNFEKETVEVYLGNFAEGFFGWMVPVSNEKARIGLGCRLGKNPAENLQKFISQKYPDAKSYGTKSSLIPCGAPLTGTQLQKGNMMLLGDAAFQTKATTGGGIIFGMKAGNILAETIAEHLKHKKPLSQYEKNLAPLNKELRMHWKIRKYFDGMKNGEIDALIAKLKAKGIEEFLEKEGDMDNPSKFVGKLAGRPKFWFMARTLLDIARS
ncbi:MAG: NAD(P)/FAD-dependent oxidoreductase [Candidatus Diapherotrites archaeon]|nr:NAD(P)/FAD-dependent oxidoreductase [Candidatus Diapherotrites archaeon]